MPKRSLLIYEKPLSPDEVIKRAEAWKKIFKSKDHGEPVEVVINRRVRDNIYEVFFEDIVKGLLKSPKEHTQGEKVKAYVVMADYTTKTFRTKLHAPRDNVLEPGNILMGKVLKVASNGGIIVLIKGRKCFVPRNRIGPAIRYPLRDIKRGEVECLILKVQDRKVVAEILNVRV